MQHEDDTPEGTVEPDGTARPASKVPVERSQAYFWTERWQQGEREAESDIWAGQVHRSTTVDEAIQFLDRDDV